MEIQDIRISYECTIPISDNSILGLSFFSGIMLIEILADIGDRKKLTLNRTASTIVLSRYKFMV